MLAYCPLSSSDLQAHPVDHSMAGPSMAEDFLYNNFDIFAMGAFVRGGLVNANKSRDLYISL